jgi:hypothetical protein
VAEGLKNWTHLTTVKLREQEILISSLGSDDGLDSFLEFLIGEVY